MNGPLATYIHDHLAGSRFALDLMEALRDQHPEDPLGRTARELVTEIEKDRSVLEEIGEKIGKGSPNLKEGVAWLAEKAARLKLSPDGNSSLGVLQGIELLTLGIQGKAALWKALAAAQQVDPRLRGPDYAALTARAESQYEQLERHRLEAVRVVFATSDRA